MKNFDHNTINFFIIILSILITASTISFIIKLKYSNNDKVKNLISRINSWWLMCIILLISLALGKPGVISLFLLISFLALREYISILPSHKSDHRVLFWTFFIFTPFQYYLILSNWYGLFSILIPVYAFLLIPIRSVIIGDHTNFLQRASQIQWGLMLCVYCISHIPALLILPSENLHTNINLILFLIFVCQSSDVLQYIFGNIFGKNKISPNLSPNKTIEGFLGGIITSACIGGSLHSLTPFSFSEAIGISFLINCLGFFGDLTMSAIKRDNNVKDYGEIIKGHGGILDRMDSLCFAAPIFFHITRYFYF